MNFNDTVAAVATPAGMGGIGVVRISGPEAFAIASKVLIPKDRRRSLINLKGYRALLGDVVDADGRVLDEAVALGFRAPRSYTGEDVVEFKGGFSYSGSPATAEIQFVLDLSAGTLQVYHLSINGEGQNQLMLAAMVQKVFESY